MAECGAKTRAGGTCKRKASANGRCYFHGGKSTGPPKGNKNNWQYGIYAQGIKESEKDLYGQIKVGTLDDEIRITKLQHARALKAQKEFEEGMSIAGKDEGKTGFELSSIEAETRTNAQGEFTKKKVVRKRPDFRKEIFRLSGRIAKLELTRNAIMTGPDEDIDWSEIGFRAAEATDLSTDTPPGPNSPKG